MKNLPQEEGGDEGKAADSPTEEWNVFVRYRKPVPCGGRGEIEINLFKCQQCDYKFISRSDNSKHKEQKHVQDVKNISKEIGT